MFLISESLNSWIWETNKQKRKEQKKKVNISLTLVKKELSEYKLMEEIDQDYIKLKPCVRRWFLSWV